MMGTTMSAVFSKPWWSRGHRNLRECVVDCILFPKVKNFLHEEGRKDNDERYFDFLEVLHSYVRELDSDFDEYSKSALKIRLELNGFDVDESFRLLNRLKDECLDNLVGTIDIKSPAGLENSYVALLEF